MKNHHFLYASIVGLLNDFTSAGLSAVFCFDDPSFSPSVFLDYELFQGFSLNLNARLPLDMPTPSGINEGELGPGATGSWFTVSIGAKLRI